MATLSAAAAAAIAAASAALAAAAASAAAMSRAVASTKGCARGAEGLGRVCMRGSTTERGDCGGMLTREGRGGEDMELLLLLLLLLPPPPSIGK